MLGAVAKCRKGIIGIITGIELTGRDTRTLLYTGITLDNKSWQSLEPNIIAKSVEEYIDKFVLHKELIEA